MNRATLLQLAFDAMSDPDALEVFADAVLEAEWFDPRPTNLISPRCLPLVGKGGWMKAYAEGAKRDRHLPDWSDWPRACAAVLLCDGWSTTPWFASSHLMFTGLQLQGRHGPINVYIRGRPTGPANRIRITDTMAILSNEETS